MSCRSNEGRQQLSTPVTCQVLPLCVHGHHVQLVPLLEPRLHREDEGKRLELSQGELVFPCKLLCVWGAGGQGDASHRVATCVFAHNDKALRSHATDI